MHDIWILGKALSRAYFERGFRRPWDVSKSEGNRLKNDRKEIETLSCVALVFLLPCVSNISPMHLKIY